MYKIAVLGDKESVQGFKAVGFDVVECDNCEQAEKLLKKLADDEYAIIYIVEELVSGIKETVDSYADSVIPAIIPIPSNKGSLGIGKEQLIKAVEKAVGSNILK